MDNGLLSLCCHRPRNNMINRITIWSSCFCIGALSAVFWSQLPSIPSLYVLLSIEIVTGVIITLNSLKNPQDPLRNVAVLYSNITINGSVVVNSIVAGILWLASVGHFYYAWQLPENKIQQDVIISAQVLSGGCVLAAQNGLKVQEQGVPSIYRYVVKVSHIDNVKARDLAFEHPLPSLINLSSSFTVQLSHMPTGYSAKREPDGLHLISDTTTMLTCLHNGDTFQAVVKMKPAYGVINPIGFNRQQHLVSKAIHATGYIKHVMVDKIIHQHTPRYVFSQQLLQVGLQNTRWWNALLLGDRALLTVDDWALLQQTGTGHLFSISGMHLSIVAGITFLVFGIVMFLVSALYGAFQHNWPRRVMLEVSSSNYKLFSGLRLGSAAPIRLGIFSGVLLVSALYTMLSGLALPVVRAFILLCIAFIFSISSSAARPIHVAILMLMVSLCLFPLGILSASFYLSIGAVLVIWFSFKRFQLNNKSWWRTAFQLQCILCVATLPLTMLWFENISIISLVANSIAVPFITLILPVSLVALLTLVKFPSSSWMNSIAQSTLEFCDAVLTWLIEILNTMVLHADRLNVASVSRPVDTSSVVCLLLAALLVFLPTWRFKSTCVVLLILPILSSFIPSNDNYWHIHILDAGQASAAIITKGSNAIVIDSGARFNDVARTAESDMLSLLKKYNVSRVDFVIHTHGDNDHAGGRAALEQFEVSQNAVFLSPVQGCERGKMMVWEGLKLAFFWPRVGNREDSNAQSCVVKITDGTTSILFSGDIEKESEYALLYAQQSEPFTSLQSRILVAPHHGSKTSSTEAFIKAVNPDSVIYSQGFANRWSFPSKSVFDRYKALGIKQYLTSYHGYVKVAIDTSNSCNELDRMSDIENQCSNAFHISTSRVHHKQRWYLPGYWPSHL